MQYLLAVTIIFLMLIFWVGVQHLARSFARKHPELGPAKEEGTGCGGLFCLCEKGQDCPKEVLLKNFKSKQSEK